MITEHTVCRACGSKSLFNVADFGEQALANSFRKSPSQEGEPRYPLVFKMCSKCWLGQLSHIVPKEELYSYYPYVTSTSKTMAEHLDNVCQNVLGRGKQNASPLTVEVGSNTGLLLKLFKERQARVHGFEPAKNLAEIANCNGVQTTPDFFNQATAAQFVAVYGRADLVLGRHVLAHIDSWRGFFYALDTLCQKHALVVLEVPYLVELLDGFQFDTVYHEHLSYVSLKAVEALLEDSPFYVQDLDRTAIHGGSITFYIRRRHQRQLRVSEMVEHIRILEESRKIGEEEIWKSWSAGVRELRDEIGEQIRLVWDSGVAGYGASAKGSMLLQYCGLTEQKLIKFVVDSTAAKQGRFMPGTNIPILAEEALLKEDVRYALILAWNFAKEIKRKNEAFKGKWIVPIPQVRID